MVKTPVNINGGFYDVKQSKASKAPSVVIAVDDLEKSMTMVKKAGGKILGKSQDIPGIGLWVSFRDTEGNRVRMAPAQGNATVGSPERSRGDYLFIPGRFCFCR